MEDIPLNTAMSINNVHIGWILTTLKYFATSSLKKEIPILNFWFLSSIPE